MKFKFSQNNVKITSTPYLKPSLDTACPSILKEAGPKAWCVEPPTIWFCTCLHLFKTGESKAFKFHHRSYGDSWSFNNCIHSCFVPGGRPPFKASWSSSTILYIPGLGWATVCGGLWKVQKGNLQESEQLTRQVTKQQINTSDISHCFSVCKPHPTNTAGVMFLII